MLANKDQNEAILLMQQAGYLYKQKKYSEAAASYKSAYLKFASIGKDDDSNLVSAVVNYMTSIVSAGDVGNYEGAIDFIKSGEFRHKAKLEGDENYKQNLRAIYFNYAVLQKDNNLEEALKSIELLMENDFAHDDAKQVLDLFVGITEKAVSEKNVEILEGIFGLVTDDDNVYKNCDNYSAVLNFVASHLIYGELLNQEDVGDILSKLEDQDNIMQAVLSQANHDMQGNKKADGVSVLCGLKKIEDYKNPAQISLSRLDVLHSILFDGQEHALDEFLTLLGDAQ
jgi:tetratricopeptide (TPR) repeat protein